jgi:hypothetical protein
MDIVGATLAAAAMRAGLIDEYVLATAPVLLGGGKPFFTALESWVPLRLVETRAFPDGVLLTRYEARRGRPGTRASVGPVRGRPRSVPLAAGEAAEGDQPDERDDDPEPEAPDDRHHDADDDQDPAERDASGVAAGSACHHVLLSE